MCMCVCLSCVSVCTYLKVFVLIVCVRARMCTYMCARACVYVYFMYVCMCILCTCVCILCLCMCVCSSSGVPDHEGVVLPHHDSPLRRSGNRAMGHLLRPAGLLFHLVLSPLYPGLPDRTPVLQGLLHGLHQHLYQALLRSRGVLLLQLQDSYQQRRRSGRAEFGMMTLLF